MLYIGNQTLKKPFLKMVFVVGWSFQFTLFIHVFVAMLYADLCYGYGLFPLDTRPTVQYLSNMLKQFDAIQSADSYVVLFWHNPEDTKLVHEVMRDRNLQDIENIYWYKPEHIVAQQTNRYVKAVETGSIGFYPNANAVTWHVSQDPKQRHNLFQTKSVRLYAKGTDNNPINVTEKPWKLAHHYMSQFCNPKSNVCVVGAGAGGDCVGGILSALNVYGVELDETQFKSLYGHLHNICEIHTKAYNKGCGPDNIIGSKPNVEDPEPDEDQIEYQQDLLDALTQPTTSFSQEQKTVCMNCGKGFDQNNVRHRCSGCHTSAVFHKDCLNIVQHNDDEYSFLCNRCNVSPRA